MYHITCFIECWYPVWLLHVHHLIMRRMIVNID